MITRADTKSKAQKLAEIADDQTRIVVKVLEEQKEAKLDSAFMKPSDVGESIKENIALGRDLYKSDKLTAEELEEYTRALNTKAGFTIRSAIKAITK